jgi:hypothetical protein
MTQNTTVQMQRYQFVPATLDMKDCPTTANNPSWMMTPKSTALREITPNKNRQKRDESRIVRQALPARKIGMSASKEAMKKNNKEFTCPVLSVWL